MWAWTSPAFASSVVVLLPHCEVGFHRARLIRQLSLELELAGHSLASDAAGADFTIVVDANSCESVELSLELRSPNGRAWRERVALEGEVDVDRMLALRITELVRNQSAALASTEIAAPPTSASDELRSELHAYADAVAERSEARVRQEIEDREQASAPLRAYLSLRLTGSLVGDGTHLGASIGAGVAHVGPFVFELGFYAGGAELAVDEERRATYARVGGVLEASIETILDPFVLAIGPRIDAGAIVAEGLAESGPVLGRSAQSAWLALSGAAHVLWLAAPDWLFGLHAAVGHTLVGTTLVDADGRVLVALEGLSVDISLSASWLFASL